MATSVTYALPGNIDPQSSLKSFDNDERADSADVGQQAVRLIAIPGQTADSQQLNSTLFSADTVNARTTYRKAREALASKDYNAFKQLRQLLDDYPLSAYLDYKYLAQTLHTTSFDDIATFAVQHDGSDRLVNRLRRGKLFGLARRGAWQDFLAHYDKSKANERLRCHHARALYQTGAEQEAIDTTRKLWLTPKSMPEACDPIFHIFTSSSQAELAELAWLRFVPALRDNEFTLAKYLLRFLEGDKLKTAQSLIELYRKPERIPRQWAAITTSLRDSVTKDATRRGIQLLLLKRLAQSDIEKAVHFIAKKIHRNEQTGLAENYHALLLEEIKAYVIQRYALSDYNDLPRIYKKLGEPSDDRSMQWMLRAYLSRGDWRQVTATIDNKLPEHLRETERWQYWRLRARQLSGSLDSESDNLAFDKLTKKASFYGFAASKMLDKHFSLEAEHYRLSTSDIAALTYNVHIRRALEHFVYGDIDEANLEWITGLKGFDQQQTLHAAYLASSIGWHQQAILSTAQIGSWQHYAIRFPNILSDVFESQALRHHHPPEWLYATARQESALASHAHSHAGAIGLMQILPRTAKSVARKNNLSYSKSALYDPGYSIRLGSLYLDQLYQRYGSRALSSAAYNAGPHRLESWLKNLKQSIPLDAWIETIRFSETRQYVQNIMSFGLIHSALRDTSDNLNTDPRPAPRPWPVFSFLDESEFMVHPYKQQIQD